MLPSTKSFVLRLSDGFDATQSNSLATLLKVQLLHVHLRYLWRVMQTLQWLTSDCV